MKLITDIGWWWRNALTWSPPAWKRVVSKDVVRDHLSPEGRLRLSQLEQTYPLEPWSRCCTLQDWRESLYVLDLISTSIPPGLPEGRALDVGAKNGCALPGLATGWGRGCDAVELDAHRRYAWGSTRRVYGEAMAAALPDCRFIAGDVRALSGPYSLVTWFLPFLSAAPLEAWGLPGRYLAPSELLAHVLSLLAPGGALLVVNQGEREAALQRDAFAGLGIEASDLGRVVSALSPFRKERFGFLVRAPAHDGPVTRRRPDRGEGG